MLSLAFGVGLCVSPTVAYAELLDISTGCKVKVINKNSNQIVWSDVSGSVGNTSNTFVALNMGTEQYTNVHENTTSTFTGSGSTSVNYNGATTGSTSNSGYYNSTGHDYGSYDNPNTVLGDDLGYGADTYVNGTNVESGTVSLSEHGTGTGTYNLTGSDSGSTTGQNQTIGSYYHEYNPDDILDTRNFDTKYCVAFYYSVNGVYPENTILQVPVLDQTVRYYTDTGAHGGFVLNGYRVVVGSGTNLYDCTRQAGWVAPHSFAYVVIIYESNNPPHELIDSMRFPYPHKIYIDLGKNYLDNQTNQIGQQTQQQTNEIGQQTQNQTNQLKDTTGANTILDGATTTGNNIKNNVTFASQLEGVGTQLATLVASADASEAGFTLPSWTFENTQIWPEMTVSPWENMPIDIKSKIRLFNTMVFAVFWIKSLWNWLASIFGFEQIDDSSGEFGDMFEEDESGGLMRRGIIPRR